jgi:hypothetical protein
MARKQAKSDRLSSDYFSARLEAVAKEIKLAYKRVNGSVARQLRWLVEFSELDLDSLSHGQWLDVGWELVMFCVGKSPDVIPQSDDDRNAFFTLVADRDWLELMHNNVEEHLADWDPVIHWEPKAPREYSLNEPVVRKFHIKAKEILDLLFSGQAWEIAPPSKAHYLQLTNVKKGKPIQVNLTPLKPFEIFISRVFDLIRDEEERLNVCANPRCGKRFVATKKNRAKYHSIRCSTYVRVAKSRGKKL